MKTHSYYLLLLFLFTACNSFSQKLAIEFNRGVTLSKLIFTGTDSKKITNQANKFGVSSLYSISVRGKAWKNLYVKTELGISKISNDIKIDFSAGTNRSLDGKYVASYVYYVIMPELRFFKKCPVFVNGGVAGYSTISGNYSSSDAPVDPFNGTFMSLVTHAGVAPTIKDFGIVLAAGFHHVVPGITEHSPPLPNFGFNQWNFRLGICYAIK
jgi:hypothetical protein